MVGDDDIAAALYGLLEYRLGDVHAAEHPSGDRLGVAYLQTAVVIALLERGGEVLLEQLPYLGDT